MLESWDTNPGRNPILSLWSSIWATIFVILKYASKFQSPFYHYISNPNLLHLAFLSRVIIEPNSFSIQNILRYLLRNFHPLISGSGKSSNNLRWKNWRMSGRNTEILIKATNSSETFLFKIWANPGLFFVFYFRSFQTNNTIFTTNECEKCHVHPVSGAGIRTHDLWNVSLLP